MRKIQITLDDDTLLQVVVKYLIIRMDDLERIIIGLEKVCAEDPSDVIYYRGKLEDYRKLFMAYNTVLEANGFDYDDAAKYYDIPTLRRDEKFTAN